MAERVEPTHPEPSAAEQAAEDLSVMFPDSSITIAGETVIVTEYPFLQWLELKPLHTEFLASLAELVGHSDSGIELDELMEFFEDQFEHVQALIAASIDRPLEFFKPLKEAVINELVITWWHVNKNFFLKSVRRTLRKQNKVLSAGQTSTKP